MLDVLYRAEKSLPSLLADRTQWRSVFVNYHPPFVERLWLPFEDGRYRIYLHRIHLCEPEEALRHPHGWPSAMRVHGEYEMGIGYGAGDTPPPLAARIILAAGSCYEMTEPDSWHYVRPLNKPALSLMVTGEPWSRSAPRSPHKLPLLTVMQRRRLFQDFDARYR